MTRLHDGRGAGTREQRDDVRTRPVMAEGDDTGQGRSPGRRIVGGLYMSLDGVVDSIDGWHHRYLDDEMTQSIDAALASADAVLLGRRTYLEFAELWPALGRDTRMARFMNESPKYVVSSSLATVGWDNSTLLGEDLPGELALLKAQPGKNIVIPGSPTLIRSLLTSDLLDELALHICPVVVGVGMRLFEDIVQPVPLALVEQTSFASGVLSVTYQREDRQ